MFSPMTCSESCPFQHGVMMEMLDCVGVCGHFSCRVLCLGILTESTNRLLRTRHNVRATSILCLLGFGLGLGSVLLYRLYTRFISPLGGSNGRRKRATSPSFEEQRFCKQIRSDRLVRTPSDVECSKGVGHVMGNQPPVTSQNPCNDPSVSFSPKEGLHFRGLRCSSVKQEGSDDATENLNNCHNDSPTHCDVINGNVQAGQGLTLKHGSDTPSSAQPIRKSQRLSASSVGSDYGFVSGENFSWTLPSGTDEELVSESPGTYSLLTNFSLGSVNERSQRAADELANFHSGGDGHFSCSNLNCDNARFLTDYAQAGPQKHSTPDTQAECELAVGDVSGKHTFLRRQHSLPSEMGASFLIDDDVFRDCIYQGHSIDLGENLSGVMTPDSEMLENSVVGEQTANNMDKIQHELRRLRLEIDSMNDEMTVLNSRENLSVVATMATVVIDASDMGTQTHQRMMYPLQVTKKRSSSLTCMFSDDSATDHIESQWNHHHTSDYMWDYQSDLAVEGVYGDTFLAQRPVVRNSGFYIGSRPQTPMSDVEKHLFDVTNSSTEFDCSGSCGKRVPQATLSDLYIDDDISTIACLVNFDYQCPLAQISDTTYSTNLCNVKDKCTDVNMDNSDIFYTPRGVPHKSDSASCVVSPVPHSCDNIADVEQVGTPKKTAIVSPSNTKKSSRVGVAPSPLTTAQPATELLRWQVDNVSGKYNMFEYAEREWGGNTEHAHTMRKAYHQIPSLFGLSHLCMVRGDNYCALRSVLYQALVNNLLAYRGIVTLDSAIRRLESVFEDRRYGYLHSWHFANRLPYSKDKVKDTLKDCLRCLCEQIDRLSQLNRYEDRAHYLHLLLNHNPEVDLQLLEAVKVLMMLNALSLYEDNLCGNRVPIFVWLLYARETSHTPEMLFRNHIDKIGDTSGIEQIEMFLLGHTLSVKIEVARPSQYGKDDFVSHYPDDGADSFPKVYMIAEDSHHYNVMVK